MELCVIFQFDLRAQNLLVSHTNHRNTSTISKEIVKLLQNKDYIDKILKEGAEKADKQASQKIKQIKKIIGF